MASLLSPVHRPHVARTTFATFYSQCACDCVRGTLKMQQLKVTAGSSQQLRLPGPRRGHLVVQAKKTSSGSSGKAPKQAVNYGSDWYAQTREAAKPRRTVREEMEYRRAANQAANNGKERKDLYTANWDGSEYKGSQFNILTLLAALFVLTPVAGLVFAKLTYGTLWG